MTFGQYIKRNYRAITLVSYLLPILVAVIVSLAHVITFWDITNPMSWSIFLSIGIEVAVLSSIAASRISNWAWMPFLLVTLIQIIGNVFFSYSNIDVNGTLFKNWVELFDPLFTWLGWDTANNVIVHKRILATFSGASIPLIAITFFQFFIHEVRLTRDEIGNVVEPKKEPEPPKTDETKNVLPVPEDIFIPKETPAAPEVPVTEPETVQTGMEKIMEELSKPNEARTAIENMRKIDPEKMRIPYGGDLLSDQATKMSVDRQQIVDKWEKLGLLDGLSGLAQAGVSEDLQNYFPDITADNEGGDDTPDLSKSFDDIQFPIVNSVYTLPSAAEPAPSVPVTEEPQSVIVVYEDEKKKLTPEVDHQKIVEAVAEQEQKNRAMSLTDYPISVPKSPAPQAPQIVTEQPMNIKDRVLSRIKVYKKNG